MPWIDSPFTCTRFEQVAQPCSCILDLPDTVIPRQIAVSVIRRFFRNIQKLKNFKKIVEIQRESARQQPRGLSCQRNVKRLLTTSCNNTRDADAPATGYPERSDRLTLPSLFAFTLDSRIFFHMGLIYFIIITLVALIYRYILYIHVGYLGQR